MNKRCPQCNLINFADAENCARCKEELTEIENSEPQIKESTPKPKFFKRAAVCLLMCVFVLLGFYISLVGSSKPLNYDQKRQIYAAINVLDEKGFSGEVFLLRYLTAFRSTDNWLNASVVKENAYAATNFPLEIMTIYPDFFIFPADDTERAVILLHEARHLMGEDEKAAYKFVWENRNKLGWTRDVYGNTPLWRDVRKQTREIVPELFVCPTNEFDDCTEF